MLLDERTPSLMEMARPPAPRPGFVHRYLVVPKLLYVGLNLVVYAVHAYGTDFFRRAWDLQLSQIGYISALSGFNFLGSIFWSSVADRTGRHKTILVGCTALYALLMFALNFRFGAAGLAAKILYTAGCFGLAQFVLSALFPLVDNQVMSILSEDPALSKDTFGRQRLWGTFAHSGVTILANQANQWYLQLRGDSPRLEKYLGNYLGMFLVLIVSAVFFIGTVVAGIPNRRREPEATEGAAEDKDAEAGQGAAKGDAEEDDIIFKEPAAVRSIGPSRQMLAIPAFLFFILVVLVSGVVRSSMSFFQTYFIIALHGGAQKGKDQAALVALPRIVSEVGVYFFGKQLFRVLGPHWMLIMSQAMGILRMAGYAAMPTQGSGAYIFPYFLELLKGLNSGLFSSSAVRLANDMAPEGCGNTAQGIVAGTYAGMSTVLGGLVGGFIVGFFPSTIEGERQGMQVMFFTLSGAGAVFLVLFVLKYWLVDRVICTRNRN